VHYVSLGYSSKRFNQLKSTDAMSSAVIIKMKPVRQLQTVSRLSSSQATRVMTTTKQILKITATMGNYRILEIIGGEQEKVKLEK